MFLSLLSTLVSAAPVPDPKETSPPKGPPPVVMVVTVGKDGRAFVEQTVLRHIPATRTIEVKSGDKIEKRHDTRRFSFLNRTRSRPL
jgi:hypothetical protein